MVTTLDIVKNGEPFVNVDPKNLTPTLDIVYQGQPFFGYYESTTEDTYIKPLILTPLVKALSPLGV